MGPISKGEAETRLLHRPAQGLSGFNGHTINRRPRSKADSDFNILQGGVDGVILWTTL